MYSNCLLPTETIAIEFSYWLILEKGEVYEGSFQHKLTLAVGLLQNCYFKQQFHT